MDYTDGSREAKLLQNLINLIVAAMERHSGPAQGYLPEVILKEMKKKGFNDRDFSMTVLHPEFEKQYDNALRAANVPYIISKALDGNTILIVQKADEDKLYEIDAKIKKSNTKYTRTLYIKDFLENEQALGHQVFELELKDPVLQDTLANKSFTHHKGFVTSMHDGKCYFSESATDSCLSAIFLDTALYAENGILRNVKEANFTHERQTESTIRTRWQNKEEFYLANNKDNRADFFYFHDGIVERCRYVDDLRVSLEARKISDFANMPEALSDFINQSVAEVHNSEIMSESEFFALANAKPEELATRAETLMLTQSKLLHEIVTSNSANPSVYGEETAYIDSSVENLAKMKNLLKEKSKDITLSPQIRNQMTERLRSVNTLLFTKTVIEQVKKEVERSVQLACVRDATYEYKTPQEKLEFELSVAESTLRYSNSKALKSLEKTSSFSREAVLKIFTNNFMHIKPYTPPMQSTMNLAGPSK